MDSDKVIKVCEAYSVMLLERWKTHYETILGHSLIAKRFDEEAANYVAGQLPTGMVYAHFLFMTEEIPRLLDAGRTEKAMRWLGWLQGALWGLNFETLHDAKLRNAPEGAEYSRDA